MSEMRCHGCRTTVAQTHEQAKERGWTTWSGGALCPKCGGGKPTTDEETTAEYDQHHSMGFKPIDPEEK